MNRFKRKAVISLIFCLSISLLFSSCKDSVFESSIQSEEKIETKSTSDSTEKTEPTTNESSIETEENVLNEINENLSVSILSSDKGGDSTILRFGDTEILIDTALGDATLEAVEKVMKEDEDHTWEYVIFTHPDKDHIGKAPELFNLFASNEWQVEHLIDFGVEREDDQESNDEKDVLRNYKTAIKSLENTDYYSPNGDLSPTKLTKEYIIDTDVLLTILYNADSSSGKDNDQSVCCLFHVGEQKLLFTGDLEEKGENDLLKYHRKLLKNVTFFKAGHHGSSRTSNTQRFVDWIRPAYVAITYNSKVNEEDLLKSIEKFLKYTDYIYPTWVKDDEGGSDPLLLFGECEFEFNGKKVIASTEFSQDCTIKQADSKGTSWYWRLVESSKITDEINTYFLDENIAVDNEGLVDTSKRNGNFGYYNCTLVKYGHYDILIDCGSIDSDSKDLMNKLKDYVVDGIIECVIVTHYHLSNYSQLIGTSPSDKECVLDSFDIERIIYNDNSMTNCNDVAGTAYSMYLSKVLSVPDRIPMNKEDSSELLICDGLKLNVYRGNNSKHQVNEDDYSLVSVVDFYGRQMVFVGDLTDYTWFNDTYANSMKNVSLVRFSSSYVEYTKMKGLDAFCKNANPDIVVLGSPVNHWSNGQYFIKGDSISGFANDLINYSRNQKLSIYSCGYIDNNVNQSVSGDIDFTMFKTNKIVENLKYDSYVSCCFNGGSGKKSILNNSYYAYVPDDIRMFPTMD